jgi:small subunit ribosomal protein S4
MKIGPKYKIAKRLGASVFEKTQTQKFALRTQNKKGHFRPRPKSNYGKQLLEKQKVRYTYGITEKQFAKYVKDAIERNPNNSSELLYNSLERRLDNVVLRSGFAPTRRAARQMVSHGHIYLNGRKLTVPSHKVKKDDLVSVREASKEKGMFTDLNDRFKDVTVPKWIKVDIKKMESKVTGEPDYVPSDTAFDLLSVIQFYKR